jgi:hypothetical protein
MRFAHIISVAAIAVAGSITTTVTAFAHAASQPSPRLTGSITPLASSGPEGDAGVPIQLRLGIAISHPDSSRFRLGRVVVKFPTGALANGALFPSCNAATLKAAHGRLGVCPRGSKIGSGRASVSLVDLGIQTRATLTLFNGPGGDSVTFNVNLSSPSHLNVTFAAGLKETRGTYAYVLTSRIPPTLQQIVGSPVLVKRIDVTVGALRVIDGVRRGYLETLGCPSSHHVPFHTDVSFKPKAHSGADAMVHC